MTYDLWADATTIPCTHAPHQISGYLKNIMSATEMLNRTLDLVYDFDFALH